MSLLKGLNTVSVAVTNWAQAKKFYHDTLGLPILMDIEEAGWCELGEGGHTTLALNLWRDATPPVRGGTIPIFTVDDCVQAVAELRRRGVKCGDPVTIPGMVAYADVHDPEGNLFQIAQSLAPTGV
ncbi:MAG TPA: VOC family protein [Anaerolineae bacterium]|nr:VOC family protein [Anaerolineae bacterium]